MRIEGRVEAGYYVITGPSGVMKKTPIDEARQDRKLAKAIERNGWEPLES
jgi:hypothetical protein